MTRASDINGLNQLLKGKPRKVHVAFASRAASRAFPMIERQYEDARGRNEPASQVAREIVLPIIRGLALSFAAARYPEIGNKFSHVFLDTVAEQALTHTLVGSSVYSACGTIYSRNYNADATLSFADNAFSFDGLNDEADTFFEAAFGDYTYLENSNSVGELARLPLWRAEIPAGVRTRWSDLKLRLLAASSNWDVWTRWYDAVLAGNPTLGGEELDIYRVTLDSEDDWKKGPAHVNALIKAKEEEIAGRAPPPIPDEVPGLTWDIDAASGLFQPTYRLSGETDSEIGDLESQRPYLLECANDLAKAVSNSSSNRVKIIMSAAAERYCKSIDKHSSVISIDEVYAAGLRLRNASEQVQREAAEEGMPQAAAEIGEAVNSVVGLHGPFILATRRGRESDARARSHNRTQQQDLNYKLKARELAHSIESTTGIVSNEGKALLSEINNEIATGPFPERSTVGAESANANLISTFAKIAAANYSAKVFLATLPGQKAIAAGAALATPVIAWMLANITLLTALALACPEGLAWLPYFLTWLQTRWR